jgi:uncharacterized protein (TIGR00730 family)
MTITIYAASSPHVAPVYLQAAKDTGRLIAEKGFTCINGAGKTGLMAHVTDAVLENGGQVIGVIPQFMVDNRWHHPDLTECIVTPDLHTRKQLMAQRADACIALPGGVGTLEELLEIITWKQLGLHAKPIVILNTNAYFDPLLHMLAKAEAEHFMHHSHAPLWTVAATPAEAINQVIL